MLTQREAAAYLAAMVDGEGHIRSRINRSVSVANTDWDLIEAVQECCDVLGFRYRTSGPYPLKSGKSVTEVAIPELEQLERFREIVPLRSARKREALDTAIANYRRCRRPTKEWLEQKYIEERLSLSQIVDLCEARNPVTVWGWLRRYGIPTRDQSEGQRKHPRPDEEWLRSKYQDDGLSLAEIARLTGAPHSSTVHGWMRSYGIQTRPRSKREKEHTNG